MGSGDETRPPTIQAAATITVTTTTNEERKMPTTQPRRTPPASLRRLWREAVVSNVDRCRRILTRMPIESEHNLSFHCEFFQLSQDLLMFPERI